jgi:hypothetical protein
MSDDDEIRAAAERCADGWGLARSQTAPAVVLRELLADAKAVARAYLNPWRPIDTAPRDGTRVLLWWDGWDIQLGSWHPLHGWQTGPIVHCQPTHWTPLPLPPAPAA